MSGNKREQEWSSNEEERARRASRSVGGELGDQRLRRPSPTAFQARALNSGGQNPNIDGYYSYVTVGGPSPASVHFSAPNRNDAGREASQPSASSTSTRRRESTGGRDVRSMSMGAIRIELTGYSVSRIQEIRRALRKVTDSGKPLHECLSRKSMLQDEVLSGSLDRLVELLKEKSRRKREEDADESDE